MKWNFTANGKGLVAIALMLSVVGLIMIYSASGVLAHKAHLDSAYFLKRQLVWLALSLLLFTVVVQVDYSRLRDWIRPMAIVIFTLLILVLWMGPEVNGAKRWFRFLGISIQPSEMAKFFTVVYLAHYVVMKGEKIQEFLRGLTPALAVVGLEVVLILVEPDLGATAIILMISCTVLFFGGVPLRQLVLVGLLAIPMLIYAMMRVPYRRERLMSYFSATPDLLGGGFQIFQSYLALGSGGALGLGLGEGRQKRFFLPEPHTDFVFSVIGEEFGLLGTLFILLLFVLLLWSGIQIARTVADPFGQLLVGGMTMMITLPALMNMGVVTGLLPTKGLALPFISYGGSSLVMNWLAVGVIVNVSKRGDV